MIFVYIFMIRPCFDSVTSMIMLVLRRILTIDGTADTSAGLCEFKQIFLLISIRFLVKLITQRESVVTYMKSCSGSRS